MYGGAAGTEYAGDGGGRRAVLVDDGGRDPVHGVQPHAVGAGPEGGSCVSREGGAADVGDSLDPEGVRGFAAAGAELTAVTIESANDRDPPHAEKQGLCASELPIVTATSRVRPLIRRRVAPDDLAALTSVYGHRFCGALERAAAKLDGPCRPSHLLASRRFFLWIPTSNSNDGAHRQLVAPYAEGCRQRLEADTQRVAAALIAWYEHELAVGAYAPGYAHELARHCAATLEQLGADGGEGSRYPAYDRYYFNAFRPDGYTRSLAELGLAELAGLQGLEAERQGVALVRARSKAGFNLNVQLFDFGQALLPDVELADASPTARREVRSCLLAVREALHSPTQYFNFSGVVGRFAPSILSAVTWADAGLPPACLERWWPAEREITARAASDVALACLVPTRGAFLGIGGIFAADTGWNRQSIIDLPEDPIVFRTRDEFAVGDAVVVASFKARAGREVLACIDARRPLRGLLADVALERWAKTTSELRAHDPDAHAVLRFDDHADLAHNLQEYARMALPLRAINAHCGRSTRLFVYASGGRRNSTDGMRPSCNTTFKNYSDDPFLKRITFPSVRKSVLVARFLDGRSMALMSPEAGNGADVLWRHYLNTPDLRTDLLSASKFLHTVLLGLICDQRPSVAAAAGMRPEVTRWLSSVAHASTIAAAFGVMPGAGTAIAEPTVFAPTPVALGYLFLTHWACRKAALSLSPAMWRARCFPVLAVCKAIGGLVCDAGLRPGYVVAARAARKALTAGEIGLPPVDVA